MLLVVCMCLCSHKNNHIRGTETELEFFDGSTTPVLLRMHRCAKFGWILFPTIPEIAGCFVIFGSGRVHIELDTTALNRGRTDRIIWPTNLTMTSNLLRAMVTTYSSAKVQGQRSVGSQGRVETLMQSVINTGKVHSSGFDNPQVSCRFGPPFSLVRQLLFFAGLARKCLYTTFWIFDILLLICKVNKLYRGG